MWGRGGGGWGRVKNVMCVKYVIPFLFFMICHPYSDVHFLKCFTCFGHFFLGGGGLIMTQS